MNQQDHYRLLTFINNALHTGETSYYLHSVACNVLTSLQRYCPETVAPSVVITDWLLIISWDRGEWYVEAESKSHFVSEVAWFWMNEATAEEGVEYGRSTWIPLRVQELLATFRESIQ